ncbi:MAG TPA: HAMP domain-containing sensor histidine kinase [Terriglobia bacterium]|nr:HAMP domain-containing sensor histidine kinase [Terriglobia bacterium]
MAIHGLRDKTCRPRRLDGRESEALPLAGSPAEFIYHDLRVPLSAILAYSELMAEDDLDTLQRKDFHQEIRSAIDRMNDLISLLMEFSRDASALREEPNGIREIIPRAIRAVAVRPEFSRIVISYKHDGLDEHRFDSGQLQRVITNLVLNACEAVSAVSGKIEVKSSGRRERMEIRITDNGPGIPEPIRHAVFQRFVSYGKTGGTGLGLASVQKILRGLGGEIYLERTGEEGTVFKVVLPNASSRWK